MITAILWDNDGVLVNTEKYYFQSIRQVFRSLGRDLSVKEFSDNLLATDRGVWHLIADRLTAGQVAGLKQQRNRIYASLLSTEPIAIEGAEDTVRRLHGSYAMAIVTSSLKEHFLEIHKRTGILQYMDFYLCNEDFGNSKPDPEPYLKALETLKAAPEECLVVEDSYRGLCAARAAGLRCWIIKSEFNPYQDFSTAEKVLSSVGEIPELLKNENHSSR